MTKSEIVRALSVFADNANVFIPGSVGGPKYLKVKMISFDEYESKMVVVLIPEKATIQILQDEAPQQYINKIVAYCDGSCLGNPGSGGWAYHITGQVGEIYRAEGKENDTTNNRMELMAAIKALQKCKNEMVNKNDQIIIITDSEYVVKTVKGEFNGQANADLITEIRILARSLPCVEFVWEPRNNNPEMTDCDKRAKKAAQEV